MTPQLQKYRFRNAENIPGDCHRTCIAMILDMDRDDVPHFMADVSYDHEKGGPEWEAAGKLEDAWLRTQGLIAVAIPFAGDAQLSDIVSMFHNMNPNAAAILGCTSENGVNHSVVMYGGKIYNPTGQQGTIKGPMKDGLWWITVLAHLTKPLQEVPAPASVETQEAD